MIYSVDRIEGKYAVLIDENSDSTDIELEKLPKIKQGDMLELKNGEYIRRDDLTAERKERLIRRTKSMFE